MSPVVSQGWDRYTLALPGGCLSHPGTALGEFCLFCLYGVGQ